MSRWPYALVLLALAVRAAAGAEVVLENPRLRAVLGGGAVATVWHSGGKEGRLVLATHTIAFGGMSAYALGDPQPRIEKDPGGGQAVPVGGRRVLLVFEGLPPEAARGLLEKAAFTPRE